MGQLHQVRILLTRERARSEVWAETITARGGVPVIVPLIRTRRVGPSHWNAARDAIAPLSEAKARVVVGLASANAAEHWHAFSAELPAGLEVSTTFVVGEATAARARALGLEVEVASSPHAVGLAEAIASRSEPSLPVLLPRARGGRDEGVEALQQRGRETHAFELYETVPVRKPETTDPAPVSWVISASPSAARAYAWHRGALVRLGLIVANTHHAAIGTTTARAAREVSLTIHAVSKAPTVDALLDTIAAAPPVVVG